jgi:excisionase family DNA binding protein
MELMTIKQTAGFLRVSMGTVRNMVQRGDLPALRVGKQIRFVREDLERWVRRQVHPLPLVSPRIVPLRSAGRRYAETAALQ